MWVLGVKLRPEAVREAASLPAEHLAGRVISAVEDATGPSGWDGMRGPVPSSYVR